MFFVPASESGGAFQFGRWYYLSVLFLTMASVAAILLLFHIKALIIFPAYQDKVSVSSLIPYSVDQNKIALSTLNFSVGSFLCISFNTVTTYVFGTYVHHMAHTPLTYVPRGAKETTQSHRFAAVATA